MDSKIFNLTPKEMLLFSKLNDHGAQTATELVKLTKIPSAKIYFMLESLVSKGLISYTQESRHKVYDANHPNQLLSLYEQKLALLESQRTDVEKYVESLSSSKDEYKGALSIQIFEGIKGIMSYHDRILRLAKKGETVYMSGSVKLTSPTLKGYFRQFHKQRVEKGVEFKIIKSAQASKLVEKFPLTQVRYISNSAPTTYLVFRESVAIIMYSAIPTAIRIKNADLAKSFKTYFTEMWK